MHRSVGKITDKKVRLFSSQTKFALQIIPFNADNQGRRQRILKAGAEGVLDH